LIGEAGTQEIGRFCLHPSQPQRSDGSVAHDARGFVRCVGVAIAVSPIGFVGPFLVLRFFALRMRDAGSPNNGELPVGNGVRPAGAFREVTI
jgi:hypothetical protein